MLRHIATRVARRNAASGELSLSEFPQADEKDLEVSLPADLDKQILLSRSMAEKLRSLKELH
jgi:hypothetical protein